MKTKKGRDFWFGDRLDLFATSSSDRSSRHGSCQEKEVNLMGIGALFCQQNNAIEGKEKQIFGDRCDLDRLELEYRTILTVRRKLPDDLYAVGTRKQWVLLTLSLLAYVNPKLAGYHDSWGRLLDTMCRVTGIPLSERQLSRYLKDFEGVYVHTSRATWRKYKTITFLPKLKELFRHDRNQNVKQDMTYSILHQTSDNHSSEMSDKQPHQTKCPSNHIPDPTLVDISNTCNSSLKNKDITRDQKDTRAKSTKMKNLNPGIQKHHNQIVSILSYLSKFAEPGKPGKKKLAQARYQLYTPAFWTEDNPIPWEKFLTDWWEYTYIQRREIAKNQILPCLEPLPVHMAPERGKKGRQQAAYTAQTVPTVEEQIERAKSEGDKNLEWLCQVAMKNMLGAK